MPYWYWRQLKNSLALTQATTNRFDFPERGAVSGLLVRQSSVNAATLRAYDSTWNIQRQKLRLVGNGNYEILNAEARHLAAAQFFETGKMPILFLPHYTGNTQSYDLLVQFGRYLGDPQYGLMLEKFASGVQFEETNTFSPTYYTAGSDALTVWALMYKDAPADMFSGGFFKKRQILNKDAATETQYAVKLPTSNPIKQIHMFFDGDLSSNIRGSSFPSPVSNVWLGVRSREEYILDNMSAAVLSRLMAARYGLIPVTKGWAYDNSAGSGSFFETCIYHERESVISPVGSTGAAGSVLQEDMDSWQDSIARIKGRTDAGVAQSMECIIYSRGQALFGNLPLLMIDPLGPETSYLDADALKDVYVEFTESNATGNTYIVLDELEKTYPA
jgi:hypothetical protein